VTIPQGDARTRKILADVSEKEVEHQCDTLMKSLGWTVVRFSQPRNTMQSPGIPDRRYYPPCNHAAARILGSHVQTLHAAFWLECKRPGGKQSAHQRAFQEMCEAADEPYVLGGIPELVQYLNDAGIRKIKLHA
jgi:hypothetical protein